MYKKKKKPTLEKELFTEAEADANRFNVKCLTILCFIVVICEILNEVGMFKVPLLVMRLSAAIALVLFSLPLIVYLVHDKMLKKQSSIFNDEKFKYLILVSTYVGIGILCVTLSFHAVILLAVPLLIAAQYKGQKSLFIWVMVATLVMVPIGVYGSFFLGSVDRNFIKNMMPEEEFMILANRIKLATSKRMLELFLHYVLPRFFSMLAILLLVLGILRRNGMMLQRQAELDHHVKQEMENINKMQSHMIDSLTTLIETRDLGTGEHVIRTRQYVRIIADRLKQKDKFKDILTEKEVELLENVAPLHDVGKIVVPDTILLKQGKLTDEEFEKMKVHTVKGGSVIRDIFEGVEDEDFLRTAEEVAMYHHERWDGSGYPSGLKGKKIPLPARIMAVADVFDALVSNRTYKEPVSPPQAIEIMLKESGTHFDPDIMEVVDEMRDEFIRVAMTPLEKIK